MTLDLPTFVYRSVVSPYKNLESKASVTLIFPCKSPVNSGHTLNHSPREQASMASISPRCLGRSNHPYVHLAPYSRNTGVRNDL